MVGHVKAKWLHCELCNRSFPRIEKEGGNLSYGGVHGSL